VTQFPTKAALRRELRARRDGFFAALDAQGAALAFRVAPGPLHALIEAARCVSAYIPVGSEADPEALLALAAAEGKATALPYVEALPVPMRFLAWKPGDPLVPGPIGLSQPDLAHAAEVEPDLILTPLIGFDRRLHRLGQGAGYYDRAFARYPDAIRVGIAWSTQETDFVPDDPWDEPLDAVLTEREWIARDREDQ
jgi:5-formyltetrahydrofolate cyclo-ligase